MDDCIRICHQCHHSATTVLRIGGRCKPFVFNTLRFRATIATLISPKSRNRNGKWVIGGSGHVRLARARTRNGIATLYWWHWWQGIRNLFHVKWLRLPPISLSVVAMGGMGGTHLRRQIFDSKTEIFQ